MTFWQIPPKIKIYEALGAIADNRIEMQGDEAKVYSSSKGKYYQVTYDQKRNAIMANDNGSYWKNYLGYPAIAFLMLKRVIKYKTEYAHALEGIAWKDINVEFKNDFSKTEEYVDQMVNKKGIDMKEFHQEIESIYEQIKRLNLVWLGNKVKPPEGY